MYVCMHIYMIYIRYMTCIRSVYTNYDGLNLSYIYIYIIRTFMIIYTKYIFIYILYLNIIYMHILYIYDMHM